MKVGYARVDLTPPEGSEFYLLGYKSPMRNAPAKGIHDRIFSNALLFDDGESQAFLWTADLLELPDDTAADLKTRLHDTFGISRDNIILGVLHNHSSIRDFHRNWEFGKYNPEYDAFLTQSVLDSYAECRRTLREASAKWGMEVVTGYYSNRNHPGKLADNTVTVVRFYDETETPFAAIVNWAVHSTAMGPSNLYLTGDLAGNTCRKLGEQWGYYPVMLNGAAGDSSNRFDRKGKDWAELERATDGLSAAIAAISTERELALGAVRALTLSHEICPDTERYRAQLRETMKKLKNGELKPSGDLPLQHLLDKCEEQLRQPPFRLTVAFGTLDIGNLRFDIFPGELASCFGERLRGGADRPVLVAGYANGFHYYFLAQEDYGLSFETIGNPVPPGEPEKIIEKFLRAGRLLDLESGQNLAESSSKS